MDGLEKKLTVAGLQKIQLNSIEFNQLIEFELNFNSLTGRRAEMHGAGCIIRYHQRYKLQTTV